MDWEELGITRVSKRSIGGDVFGPHGFCVREILLPHRVCPERWSDKAGQLTLGVLAKWGTDTITATSELGAALRLPVYYAGLKDALSVSSQYVAVRGEVKGKVIGKRWGFLPIGKVRAPLTHDHLWGNRFEVEVRNYSSLAPLDEFLHGSPFPNFFGPQRFGTTKPHTHEIGMQILRGEEPDELRSLRPHQRAKVRQLAIQAFQSYLFNLILRERMQRISDLESLERGDLVAPLNVFGLPSYSDVRVSEGGRLKKGQVLILPVPGAGVKGLGLDLANQVCRDLSVSLPSWVRGWYREASMRPLSPSYRLGPGRLYLSFELKKAQYASVLLHELLGGNHEIPTAQASSYPLGTSQSL